MAIGNILYSTSSTTISSGDLINSTDFQRSANLQVDDVSGNLNISGGINSSGPINLGSIGNLSVSGVVSDSLLTTNGSELLSWNSNTLNPVIAGTRYLREFIITGIPNDVRRITLLGVNVSVDTTSAVGNLQIGTTSAIYDNPASFIGTYSYISSSNNFNAYLWPFTGSIPLLENDLLSFAIVLEKIRTSASVPTAVIWNVTGDIMNYNYNGTSVGNIVSITGSIYSSTMINQVVLNTSSGNFNNGYFSVMYET